MISKNLRTIRQKLDRTKLVVASVNRNVLWRAAKQKVEITSCSADTAKTSSTAFFLLCTWPQELCFSFDVFDLINNRPRFLCPQRKNVTIMIKVYDMLPDMCASVSSYQFPPQPHLDLCLCFDEPGGCFFGKKNDSN